MIRQLPAALRIIPMILIMGTIFCLSHQPGDSLYLPVLPGIDKLAHLLAYGVLAAATLFAFGERWKTERAGLAVLITIIFCLLYGMTDEFHQSFIPGRAPSIVDIVADCGGAGLVGFFWLRLKGRNEDCKDRGVRANCGGGGR